MRRELLIVALFVLALRLPFLNQAVQGDDVYYLYGAQHAQIDPLHPLHARYVFLGQMVDMRGHPHPPLNSWYLGLLLAIFKDVHEIPFHAAYILFSLIAAFSALSLARRFSPYPLLATLLFLATPAFVINGNSLEADLPFLAFWLLSISLFVGALQRHSLRRLIASTLAMALAALAAYQAVILTPILLLYAWKWGRKWTAAWIAACVAPVICGAWQLYERLSSGALPAQVLAGYMQTYGLQAFEPKIRNAVALIGHLAWVVFPGLWLPPLMTIPVAIAAAFYDLNPLFWASVAVGLGILIWCARNWRDFLVQWVLIFFASAVVGAFAGSARYLLPIALPIAILATRRVNRRWQEIGFAVSLALSLGLAIVNYQHWDGYRQFARSVKSDVETKRVWINGEWGLRFYMESEGALPLLAGQAVHPGEMVVSSALCLPIQFTTGGGVLAPIAERNIRPPIPLRIVSLHGKSAYSTTMFGLRPFDVSLAVIDQVRAEMVVEHKPTLSNLPMNAPDADQQIVSGIYQLENGQWRWMSQTAVIMLKPPAQPAPLIVRFTIPEQSPAREVTVELNNQRVASQTYSAPGSYTLSTPPLKPDGASATVTITVDKTFSVSGDRRQLGVILSGVGFVGQVANCWQPAPQGNSTLESGGRAMPNQDLLRSTEGNLGILTLNRPDRRNPLSLSLMLDLIHSLDDFGADPSIRAVILASTGKAFSAGHDLSEMVGRTVTDYRRIFDVCTELMTRIQSIPQPVIAQVQGVATAAGCQLVASCDLAIASEQATFATPGVRIGLFCSTPMVALSRAVGRKRAMEMLLTGKLVDADTAAEWGLVNRVVPAAELETETRRLACQIAEASSFTVGLGKQAYYAQIDLDQSKAYAYTKEVMAMNALAHDAQEGISAFLEKRTACWSPPNRDRKEA